MRHTLRAFLTLSLLFGTAVGAQSQTQSVTCPTASALQQLEATAKKDNTAAALSQLGEAYLCLKRPKDARDTLEAAVALDYNSFDAHFLLGKSYYDLGDFDASLAEYDQLIRLAPARWQPYYQQGVIYTRLRKTDDAIRSFNSAIDASLKDETASKDNDLLADLYTALAKQFRAKPDYASEAAAYTNAQTYRPGDLSLVVSQAQALYDGGNLPAALPLVFNVLTKTPGNADAGILVADILEKQNQSDRAVRELNRVLDDNRIPRDRARLLVRRGELEVKLGRNTASLETFRLAAAADPGSWAARFNYGYTLLPKNPTAALVEFRAALKVHPDDANTLFGIASAQFALKNYSSSYAAARSAVKLFPDGPQRNAARFIAGQSAYYQKLYPEAVTEFRTLLATDTQNFQYQYWFGLSLYQTKDYNNAIVALENAVKLSPNNLEVRALLGVAYLGAKRWKDAETVLLDVTRFDPRNAEAWYNLGLSVINQGRLDQGKVYLRRAASEGSLAAKQLLAQLAKR